MLSEDVRVASKGFLTVLKYALCGIAAFSLVPVAALMLFGAAWADSSGLIIGVLVVFLAIALGLGYLLECFAPTNGWVWGIIAALPPLFVITVWILPGLIFSPFSEGFSKRGILEGILSGGFWFASIALIVGFVFWGSRISVKQHEHL